MNVLQSQHFKIYLLSKLETCEIILIKKLIWCDKFCRMNVQSRIYGMYNEDIGLYESKYDIIYDYFNLPMSFNVSHSNE